MSESRGVYSLSAAHVDAIHSLCADADIAEVIGLSGEVTRARVAEFVEEQLRARDAGSAYVFVLSQGSGTLGVCGLMNAGTSAPPSLLVAITRTHRRNGHGTFAAGRAIDVAFLNLQRDRVRAEANPNDIACQRLLARLGFVSTGGSAELTRQQWQEERNRPALGALHPALSAILAAELAAGNEVAEMQAGWPDADSVFVRLRQPFVHRPPDLPAGIQFHELNDPHWWKSEYTSENPRHILASS